MAGNMEGSTLEWLVAAIAGLAMLWKLMCVYLRGRRARFLASFSPMEDAYIVRKLTQNVEFPFISHTSLEFALFRTYAIPTISKVLVKAGRFAENSVKRADDTEILIREMTCHHVDSDRGSTALRRLNFIHGQYQISNEDYLYTLSLFILEPQTWTQKYGYRVYTTAEVIANYSTWRDVGVRMGIKDIPNDLEELEKFKDEYEEKHMVYTDSNRELADITLSLLLTKVPKLMHPVIRPLIFAMLDDKLRVAFGYPKQPQWLQSLAQFLLKFCCGTCVAFFHPPRPLAWSVDRIKIDVNEQGKDFMLDKCRALAFNRYGNSYPKGYKLGEVGPFKPNVLGAPAEGELLCPLSDRYFEVSWPPK